MRKILCGILLLITLAGCSANYTIGSMRVYSMDVVSRDSCVSVELPVDATVSTTDSTSQGTTSEAKVTPDAVATGASILGKVIK